MTQFGKTSLSVVKPLHIILLFALLQLVIALLTESLIFTHEESMWHYIGRNWFRHSLVPYASSVDNKTPLIFWIFGFSDWLFGVNYWFPRVLGTIAQSVGVFYAFKLANHLAGRQAGMLAIIIYGFSLVWRSTGGKYVSFTETYAVLCLLIAYYYCLTRSKQHTFFTAGLIAGLGLGFKLSAVFGILAIVLILIRKNKPAPFIFLAGVLSSIATLAGIIYVAGISLDNLILYCFSENFGLGSITDRSLSWKMENFANGFFYSELILLYPFVITYFFSSKRSAALNIWLICEFIGIIALGLFARNHFKHLLPALSIMSAISLAWLVDQYKIPFRAVVLIICLAFFPKTWEPIFGLKKLVFGANTKPEKFCQPPFPQPDEYSKKKLGLWIKGNTGKTDLVYIAGTGSQIQAYSERLSPTIYFNATHTKRAKEQLYADLHANKADWILVPRFADYERYVHQDTRNFIAALISKEYEFKQCMFAYDIYQLKRNQ